MTKEKGSINNNDNKYLFTEFSPFIKKTGQLDNIVRKTSTINVNINIL